jgi:hypothetical protein
MWRFVPGTPVVGPCTSATFFSKLTSSHLHSQRKLNALSLLAVSFTQMEFFILINPPATGKKKRLRKQPVRNYDDDGDNSDDLESGTAAWSAL